MRTEGAMYLVNGLNLHVIDKGREDAPVVIFLHGFPEFWYSWRKQIPFFLDNGFRVVVPDQRGYNLSDKPPKVIDYTTENLIKDIIELIKIITARKVYMVAHDWGAAVAWRIASQYPELLIKMVVINLPHPDVMKRTLKTNFSQMRKSWYIGFFQIPVVPEKILRLFNFKLLENTLTKTSLTGAFTHEDLKEYKKSWKNKNALKSMINWYRAIKYSSKSNLTSGRIKIPTLIIWGEKDLALIKNMAKESLRYCENGRLVSIPEATHWVHQDKSDFVNTEILRFLKE